MVAVAVKRRTITVYAPLFMLMASAVGLGFVNTVCANPLTGILTIPSTPNQDKPSIAVSYKANNTLSNSQDSLSICLTIPDSWTAYLWNGGPAYPTRPIFIGTITKVSCSVDGNVVYDNNTAFGGFVPGLGADFYYGSEKDPFQHVADILSIPKLLNYSIPISKLLEGSHTAVTTVSAYTTWNNLSPTNFSLYTHNNIVSNSADTLLVCLPPTITNLSVQNQTYTSTAVPLSFEINETFPSLGYGWMGFSLDNQANMTLYGNVTLVDLSEGNHSMVVYANDTFGNMGKSDKVFFDVKLPIPTPTPSPVPSPTDQPKAEFTPTAVPDSVIASTTIIYATLILAVAAATSVAALVYVKNRRNKT